MGNSFLAVPVIAIRQDTHDTKIIKFGLPKKRTIGITVSSAIVMNVPKNDGSGKTIMRPYNPIHIDDEGSFELLIKLYPDGIAGKYADSLKVGDLVSFKQTKTNIKKFQFPFEGVSRITMLAGGTGIAPMYQALIPILKNSMQTVRLLFGNKTPDDILLKKELDALSAEYPDRFTVTYVVGEDNDDMRHAGVFDITGWIDSEKIQKFGFPVDGKESITWVCGVDSMYTSLAGSRMKSLTEDSILYKLGYRDETVWRS